MLIKVYQLIFLTTLMMGSIVAISATSWFTCWLGLEINLMSLIPLLVVKLNSFSTETAIKYFLVQAMASLLIIFSSVLESTMTFYSSMPIISSIVFLSLLIKAGIPPFHFWFPQVMKAASWFNCFLILTWQKIAPFVLMSYVMKNYMMGVTVAMAAIVGALGGLNQMSLKTLITYSSITHSAWMITICWSSLNTWLVYFLIYSFISLTLITMIFKSDSNSINVINKSKWNNLSKMIFILTIMSLAGLPPFIGFLSKLIAIQTIIISSNYMLTIILISASLLSLFYYTRMTYSSMLINSKSFFVSPQYKTSFSKNLLSLTIAGNFLGPFLVYMI